MRITSPVFMPGGTIPTKYTCDGQNINPPLEIHEIPANTQSLILIMDDPDVPKYLKPDGVFDHWLLFNLSPKTFSIPENALDLGTTGKNSKGENKYTGPCPPDREHRYFFSLYAVDASLNLDGNSTKLDLLNKIRGHVLAKAELIGKYCRL